MSPIRTCLVTGEKKEQKEFLRFTMQKGVIVFDEKKKNPGRGGYVVNDSEVIEKLKSKKLYGKVCHFLKGKRIEGSL
ncbi:DUF448 domain-containing protein [Candidatus Gracilibacteria bacterium]|nr:DUF448 domain-containing protein [Candidatus Gracilibacteria bacterium]